MPRSLVFFIAIVALIHVVCARALAADCFLYIGTQSESPGAGISLAHFDSDTGNLTTPRLLLPVDGPSFFALAPDQKHLYTTNYTHAGGVSAFSIDSATGNLTLLNHLPGGDFGTSHISLDKTGHFALAANFNHGQIAVFPIQPDGSLASPVSIDKHTGSSIDPVRQKGTYPHCIMTDPTNHFALVPDLGLDKLFVYRFDEKTGALTANAPPFAAIKPGSGPRHVRFHPNGKWLYLLSEMASTITAFNWDSSTGKLDEFQSISMLPADFKGTNTAAEVVVHPNGRFLYASNRGDDSIVVYAVDPATGRLTFIQRAPSQGNGPRDFTLDFAGNWLICTNQMSNNVVVFSVDPATGKLNPHGSPVAVPAPCGLQLMIAP